jgi:hypothetical protein
MLLDSCCSFASMRFEEAEQLKLTLVGEKYVGLIIVIARTF